MARQRAAPDEILPMSQASGQSDEQKFSSGVSQSRRGDELIEIVQYAQTWKSNFYFSTLFIKCSTLWLRSTSIGKVVFTLLQRTSDKNECCCQLLRLWNKKILPNPPVEELATQKMLETTQVILHGIGIAASEVLLDGDLTMVPDVITLWPSLWNWIKLLHAAHAELCTGSHLAFDIAAAQQRYGAFVRALMSFTGFSSELLHTITEMPGYISMVTLLWIEEVRDPHRHFGFTVSNLIAPLVSH
jgi:hypothetical protein